MKMRSGLVGAKCRGSVAELQDQGALSCNWARHELSEMALRKELNHRGDQIVMSSDNEKAVRKFSADNTLVMNRAMTIRTRPGRAFLR
jgi:hypothetical protein